ncbi:MAG TPA: L-lactate dehydrogenase [Kiritimatiellia bacterium]|nr:L-lactate dehydrogenase [Kiritimatiellia bacterium]HPS08704.1 L-lactate dehydrogenase [Kiritimatiellia bacterium]
MKTFDASGKRRKVVVVGAGNVGSAFCFALAQSGLAEEIVLLDANADLAKGQALDLAHGQPYFPAVAIRDGSPADYADASVIVITAGAAQKPGETRLQLLQKNAAIVSSIIGEIVAAHACGVVLVASNPVDVLTYVALKRSGWERGRVIGSGTVLDSARFRYLLGRHCGVDVHNVHAYILGEHGDSEFAAWSMTHVAGMSMEDYCPVCRACADWMAERHAIVQAVRNSAYHIIEYKGTTCFGVGMALVRIVGAVLRGENSVLTVSTLLDGEFGLRDVCLSVPSIVCHRGVDRVVESRLSDPEREQLAASADVLKSALSQVGGAS